MTPVDFLNEFGAVANAPGGVQRLREMILQLAIQGKLVEQNPEDEPASELLKKIESKIKLLVEKQEINKPKPLPKISENQIPWKIPQSWKWARLGDVTSYAGAPKANPSDINPETWVLELEDIEKITSKILKKVQFKDRNSKSTKSVFQKGDVIYGKLRPYLDKVVVADENGVCTTEMIPLNGYGILNYEYIRWFLKSPWFIKYSNSSTHGMNLPRLGTEKARNAFLPIPPLEEQKRIVAKVDQLMALCDQLDAQQQKRSDLVKQTRISALEALANAQRSDELQTAWKRVEENLPMLFEYPEDVEDLKKCILQNAVMGKLVPQNPDDEPASELLKKIAKEKAELIKKGEIKKQKPLPEIREDEKPFEIPAGWEWCRFIDINSVQSELVSSQNFPKEFQIAPDLIEKGSGRLIGKRTVEQFGGKGPNNRFYVGQILYSKIRPSLNKAVIAPYDGLCSADMYPIKCFCSSQFMLTYILSQPFLLQVKIAENRVKMPKLNLLSLSSFVIPLPPHEEQKRIVKKTQSLLSLCDTLQKQLAKSRKVAEQLAQSVVESITGISPEKQLNGWIEEPEKAEVRITEDQVNQK